MKRLDKTFGSWTNSMTGEIFCEVEDVAESLAKGWGEVPKYISDTRAYELHLLGKAYLHQLKVIDRLTKTKEPKP